MTTHPTGTVPDVADDSILDTYITRCPMNSMKAHGRTPSHASGPTVIMVAGFIVFLITDGTPGGLDGLQGFAWGAGIALAALLLLVMGSLISLRQRKNDMSDVQVSAEDSERAVLRQGQ